MAAKLTIRKGPVVWEMSLHIFIIFRPGDFALLARGGKARYKSLKSNGHAWSKVQFKKPELDLVWNREYSLGQGAFSVNTLQGRIKVPFESKGMGHYLDRS